ncbi:hypothetical protein Hanom_Chr10g00938401 [Helianthus anomalus]
MDLKFISTHNQAGYLAAPPEKHKRLYTSLIKGLNSCRLIHALRDNPVVYESLVQDFWKTARFEAQGADGKGMIEAEIQKKKIIITEQMLREVLKFGDTESDPIELPSDIIEATLPRLSYEGKYPSLVKKFLHPYWRLLAHMFILCMTENRGGTDQLNITQTAAFIALITNEPFNFSKYIFEGMKRNVTGVRKDKFIMYQRFLQMIFNARYSDLTRSGDTLELKPMGPSCFAALTTKKGIEKKFEGLIPLEKFGQFAETEVVAADPVIVQPVLVNAMVAEEHDVQGAIINEPETKILTINSDDEGIEIMCDSGDDEELPPEKEADVVVSTVLSVITAESLALLLKSVTDKMGNTPSNLTVSDEEPSENPQDPDSLPLKRKRRDP